MLPINMSYNMTPIAEKLGRTFIDELSYDHILQISQLTEPARNTSRMAAEWAIDNYFQVLNEFRYQEELYHDA